MQGPPPPLPNRSGGPAGGHSQGGFISATPYVLPTPPAPTKQPSLYPKQPSSSSFVHAAPYTLPPLPSQPAAAPPRTDNGGSGFVSATPYVLPTPVGRPAPSTPSAGSSFVQAGAYTPPAPTAPAASSPPPAVTTTSSTSTFVHATAYTLPTPVGPAPRAAAAPSSGRPAAAPPAGRPAAAPYTPLAPLPAVPGQQLPAAGGRPLTTHGGSVAQPARLPPRPAPGIATPAAAAPLRPAVAAPRDGVDNAVDASHGRQTPAAQLPPRPAPHIPIESSAIRVPPSAGSSEPVSSGPALPARGAQQPNPAAVPVQRPPPQPARPRPSVPSQPHAGPAPALPAPPRPALPPSQASPFGAPQGRAAQPNVYYPPPPPIVAAPNTQATTEHRDDIMEARLRLFPLHLFGADLMLVHKGIPYVFYQQRPASINVVLDPQMGIRLYGEGDSRTIDLFFSRPAFCSNDKQFILRNGHDNQFFVLTLASDTPEDVVGHLETILMCFATFYKKIFTEEELKEIALHEDKDLSSSKAARSIESGGTTVSKGMVTTAGWLGSGMRGMAGFIKDHTDAGHQEVTEEQKKRNEAQAKTAMKFRKGVSAISGAVAKGTTVAGQGIAKAGHWGVQQYKDTDYYKEKQKGKEDEGPTNTDKAINVAKSSGAAIGSVWSGLVISTKIVASDVRESTADVVEHRKGKEHAELTRAKFNMAADVTVGGFRTFDLVSMYYKLVPKLALKVGAGALTYDPFKQDALHGIGWKEGWLKFEGDVREPWKPFYAVIKTYSFAWYKDETQQDLVGYFPCREILDVRPISEQQTKYPHSLQIVAKGDQQLVSLSCEDHPSWVGGTYQDLNRLAEEWIDTVLSLSFVQQKYRR